MQVLRRFAIAPFFVFYTMYILNVYAEYKEDAADANTIYNQVGHMIAILALSVCLIYSGHYPVK